MQKVESFDFGHPRSAGKGDHNWDVLLNGETFHAVEGVDFTAKPDSFATTIRNAAQRRKVGVQVRIVEGGVVFRGYPLTSDHLEKRAQRAAKRQEKKLAREQANKEAAQMAA